MQSCLDKQLNAADARLMIILEMIPDLGTEYDLGLGSDAETVSSMSRLATPESSSLGDSLLRRKLQQNR